MTGFAAEPPQRHHRTLDTTPTFIETTATAVKRLTALGPMGRPADDRAGTRRFSTPSMTGFAAEPPQRRHRTLDTAPTFIETTSERPGGPSAECRSSGEAEARDVARMSGGDGSGLQDTPWRGIAAAAITAEVERVLRPLDQ
jgi:hypothetical protein